MFTFSCGWCEVFDSKDKDGIIINYWYMISKPHMLRIPNDISGFCSRGWDSSGSWWWLMVPSGSCWIFEFHNAFPLGPYNLEMCYLEVCLNLWRSIFAGWERTTKATFSSRSTYCPLFFLWRLLEIFEKCSWIFPPPKKKNEQCSKPRLVGLYKGLILPSYIGIIS